MGVLDCRWNQPADLERVRDWSGPSAALPFLRPAMCVEIGSITKNPGGLIQNVLRLRFMRTLRTGSTR